MLQLTKISIENFRSYRGTQEFEFPLSFGLYFLTGKNGQLGSNGAGKSTFLDAITWCLYGRTVRGLKANEVLSWGSQQQTAVTLNLIINKPLVIKRTQHPNSLTLNDRVVDQTELEKTIKLNFESFLHSVIKPQFNNSFFNLTAGAKLTLFSEIMGLDFWLNKSDEALMHSKKLEVEVSEAENKLAKQEGQLQEAKSDTKKLTEKEADHVLTTQEELQNLLKQCKDKDKEIKKISTKITQTIQDLCNLEDVISRKKREVYSLESKINGVLWNLDQARQRKTSQLLALHHYEELKKKFDNLKEGDECPCCYQIIDIRHIKNHLHSYDVLIKIYNQDLETTKESTQNLIKEIAVRKAAVNVAVSEFEELKRQHQQGEITAKELNFKKRTLKDEITFLSTQIDKKDSELNPYTELLRLKKSTIKSLKDEMSIITKTLFELDSELISTKFWVKGFKRVRLYIIERTFKALELEINNSLAQLGMSDWQITLDIERETKSGSISRGFLVYVISPFNKKPVRWENWSGGETQRLQLAGDLGLSNLIMTQAGLINTIELYDEPSTHLSVEGMVDLANLLHDRAINEQKTIWIIDHAEIANFGDFKGVISVEKGKNGSRIKVPQMDA